FTGEAVVASAGCQPGSVEVGDGLPIVDAERQVKVLRGWVLEEGEAATVGDQLDAVGAFLEPQLENWGDCAVEPFGCLEVVDADPEVVEEAAVGVAVVAGDGFERVVVVVADERPVVAGAVLGSRTGSPVVAVARGCQGLPPVIDLALRSRGEADVEV